MVLRAAVIAALVVAIAAQQLEPGLDAADCATGPADLHGSEGSGHVGSVDVLVRLRVHALTAESAASHKETIIQTLVTVLDQGLRLEAADIEVDQISDGGPAREEPARKEGLVLIQVAQRARALARARNGGCVIVTIRIHVADGALAGRVMQDIGQVLSDGSLSHAFAGAGLPNAHPELVEPPRVADVNGDYAAADALDKKLDEAAQASDDADDDGDEDEDEEDEAAEAAREAADEAAEAEADRLEELHEKELADMETRAEEDQEKSAQRLEEEELKHEQEVERLEEQEDKRKEKEEEEEEKREGREEEEQDKADAMQGSDE